MASKPTSIKRKALSIQDKLDIITKVNANPDKTRVAMAKELNMPVSTLNSIMSKRNDLLARSTESSVKRKKVKQAKYKEIEETLLEWFKQARAMNIPINGTVLRTQAEIIAAKLNIQFSASNGWIGRFKKRCGLSYNAISGERGDVDAEQTDAWKDTVLPAMITDYNPKDIFNVDECAVFYNTLPDKTYTLKGETCSGGKRSKERLTALVGANMDGSEKLQLMVIGKSAKPRSFKHVKTFPCSYEHSKKAWMTGSIFERYLRRLDAKMENRKIILFVDQCAAHPKDINLRNINLQFLPANTTSVLQPMDQGVIKLLKHHYRKQLVYRLLQRMERNLDVKAYKLTVLDAMHFLSAAWESVPSIAIANCFRKAGFVKKIANDDGQPAIDVYENDLQEHSVNENDWQQVQDALGFNGNFNDYASVDDITVCYEMQSLEEICDANNAGNMGEEDEQQEDEEPEPDPIPSFSEASQGLEVVRRYIVGLQNVPDAVINCLSGLDSYMLEACTKNKKQATLDQYFKKL